MLNFQQQQMKDIEDVFLNAEAFEFVEPHMIGGIKGKPALECQVIVDRELYRERKMKDAVENVTINGLVFFIKKAEWVGKFGHIPKVDAALVFDGERYLVESVDDNMGVLEFSLAANRGR